MGRPGEEVTGLVFVILYGPIFVPIVSSFFQVKFGRVDWSQATFSAYTALANNEGKIQLVLRNSNDQQVEATHGEEVTQLYGRTGKAEATSAPASERPRSAPRARAVEPPVLKVAPPSTSDEIIFIRGNQKSVEVVGKKSPSPDGKD